jgi:LPXTG-motif cell wall-anchored protein
MAEPEPEPEMLPKTATQMPMFAVLGGVLLLLGGAVSVLRSRL